MAYIMQINNNITAYIYEIIISFYFYSQFNFLILQNYFSLLLIFFKNYIYTTIVIHNYLKIFRKMYY